MDLRLATPADSDVLAGLHATGFTDAWTAPAFADFLASPGVFGVLGMEKAGAEGFVLAREAGGEAEILTIAVRQESRRHGLGRRLIAAAANRAAEMGATCLFLEVAVDNPAALGLYRSVGLAEAGRRKGYYAREQGAAADALILKADLPLP